jgi:two-component system NtrC family sensor kinase
MNNHKTSIMNIALVGGGTFCKDILEKTTFGDRQESVNAGIVAVADSDPTSPGMVLAGRMNLLTLTDYRDLYDSTYNIHLIIILTPEQHLFEDILKTRPPHIRLMAYDVFRIFWEAIGKEEQKLRERTKEMETILNGIQEFILVITPKKEIIDVNETFLEKMCYTRSEVIGKKCHEVYQKSNTPCSFDDIVCPLKKVIDNKRPVTKVMTRLNHKGERRYIEITIFPIWENDGQISKFIEISRDITERKLEEEKITRRLEKMVEERTHQLKETHAKLIHQDKMASLGKLSASVVHEINNPNAGILNLIMLIKRIFDEGPITQKEMEQFKRYLNLMETETRRIGRIVSNLLAFSRQSKMRPTQLNINRLIEKTLVLNSNLLKINNIKVKKQMDPDLPVLTGSEDQLQQVFMNIVSNAAEAMESAGNGELIITTRYSSENGKFAISFKDTGVGIPDENFSRLFEPFFTTKKKGKGVGLGLSVAYGIIQEHHGSIYVKSEKEKGTTFIIKIPLNPILHESEKPGGIHARHEDPYR